MATGTRPTFVYATEIDPVMSTFGWKAIGLTYLAVVLPMFGALLPRDAATNWPWLIAAEVGAIAVGCINVVHFRRMVRSGGFSEPPAITVLLEVTAGTCFAGMLAYALGGTTGFYRPLIFVPSLLIAMIGNRVMIAVSWAVAVLTVTAVAVASGSINHGVAAFVVSYGSVWGVSMVMVHLLAMTSLHSDRQTLGLAEAAGIAARANGLTDGLERMLPVIADWADAARVVAFRMDLSESSDGREREPEPLRRWPEAATVGLPTSAEVAEARTGEGVVHQADRSVLVVEGKPDEVIVIVIEGSTSPKYDQLVTRFNLERMALQVSILVNRSRYIARLEDLGMTDGLTGLPNRRALTARLAEALSAAQRRGEQLAFAMIDLDEFKAFNDSHGHLAGDDLLRAFATELRARLRTIDFVARFGGEEFCALLSGTDAEGAEQLLEDLHRLLRESERTRQVTFSAGVALWDGTESGEDLIGRADRALYAAKAAGRDRTVVDHVER
jgi:diguanylate cyclase (GGDEF)-like protein